MKVGKKFLTKILLSFMVEQAFRRLEARAALMHESPPIFDAMKTHKARVSLVSAAAAAAVLSMSYVNAQDIMPSPPRTDIRVRPNGPDNFLAPGIKDVKAQCGSRSLSTVIGTIINKRNASQSYTPVFQGQLLDECIEPTYPNCSNLPPGILCIPNGCNKYKPGEIITEKGSAVTIPANGEKTVMISIPNRDFKTATFSAGITKATVVPLPKTCLF